MELPARSVGDVLGIAAADVAGIALYSVGSEPTSAPPPRASTRSRRLRMSQLDAYTRDAEAGVSDSDIALRAGCSVAQVRRWRLAHDIRRPAGRPSTRARATALALSMFGAPFEPAAVPVASVVDGRFEPPRYVLREALDYATFIRCVRVLRDAGLAATDLARGLGVRVEDVEAADKIARRS